MDISTNFDRSTDLDKHGLLQEYDFGGSNEPKYLLFFQSDLFSGFGSAYIKESLDDVINVDFYFAVHFTNKVKY